MKALIQEELQLQPQLEEMNRDDDEGEENVDEKDILDQKMNEMLVIDKFDKTYFKKTFLAARSVDLNEHAAVLAAQNL